MDEKWDKYFFGELTEEENGNFFRNWKKMKR